MIKYKAIIKNQNKPLLFSRHDIAYVILFDNPEYAELYVKDPDRWRKLVSYRKPAHCKCGARWTDTENGTEFIRWPKPDVYNGKSAEENIVNFWRSEPMCQKCYYYNEYKAGRWTMKYWREKFESGLTV